MARITRFEEIEAWQQARVLTREVYRLTDVGAFRRDFGLRDQMRRASVSVMANIAEGFERGGDKEFQQFLATAKASIGEVRSHLYVALDAGHIAQSDFDHAVEIALNVSNMIAGFMRYLKASELRGNKYKPSDPKAGPTPGTQ